MQIQPYLQFEGRCDEAIAFYKKAIGAEVKMLMRWKDAPDKSMATPTNADKVMHASLGVGEATLMMSDGHCSGQPKFQGITLSLIAKTDVEAKKLFEALGDGGQLQMPLAKTFFSSSFGMLADKFGVNWMVVVM